MNFRDQAQAQSQREDIWLLIVVSIPLLLVAFAYLNARAGLTERYAVPATEIRIPQDAAAIEEGARLARIRGCFWCHGEQLEGDKYFAEADRGIILITPNLSKLNREYSTADYVRALRYGVRPDGTSLQPAMPSFAFYNMSDADLGRIIAYIKSVPEQEGFTGEYRLMPLGWLRWTLRRFPTNVASLIDPNAARPDPAVAGPAVARGEYLAKSICTECHGDNGRLRVSVTPDLTVALGYTREEFFHLMRTGEPRHERPIDYHMIEVSKYRYGAMTDAEIDALYQYFQSLMPTQSAAGI
jgi:mono/diheme cytochrome c family protein